MEMVLYEGWQRSGIRSQAECVEVGMEEKRYEPSPFT